MVIHGDQDEIVPQEFGKEICEKLGECCNFVSATGLQHNNVPLHMEGPYFQKISEFLHS